MIGYITTVCLSVLSAVLAFLLQSVIKDNKALREKQKKETEERQEAISNGVLSLLRIQLIEYHDKYMSRPVIPVYVFENWDDMFTAYRALGGNGSIKKMNDDIVQMRLGGVHAESD